MSLVKCLSVILVVFSLTYAMSGQVVNKDPAAPANSAGNPNYSKSLLIDNFDDATILSAPAWWTFDRIEPSFPEAKDPKYGLYYLRITGKAENYYVGGMGTYVGKDASDYDTLALSVYGTGESSGTVKIQLFDDDNNDYQLEQDSTYIPLYDDQFEYELPVTWQGWRTVEIPLNKFVDVNPGVGDDIWNPDQKNSSGGLLHFQMVFLAKTEKGSIDIGLDNIMLVKKSQ